MPAARKRTTENRYTGTMGTTRRAYQTGRYGGLAGDLGHARRASVYDPNAEYAPESRRDYKRHPVIGKEREQLTERVRVLYVEQGRSVLDISSETGHSDNLIKGIIADNEFVKGKKVK